VPTAVIVPAAGRGTRLGPGAPKALRLLGGTPLLVHAVRALVSARLVDTVVVAAPPEDLGSVRALLVDHVQPKDLTVVAGGASRQDSVRLALASLRPDIDVVLVHDAARPLVPPELVDAVASAVRSGAFAVVPVVPVADTVKRVDDRGAVIETLDRSALRAVQTPQGFRRATLEQAHQAGRDSGDATDDAALVERAGLPVLTIPGSAEAFKITHPLDLTLAETLLVRRRGDRGH
jgi:2-C-methyl-D-erythritol 4-phosphate cytidylyltransferase